MLAEAVTASTSFLQTAVLRLIWTAGCVLASRALASKCAPRRAMPVTSSFLHHAAILFLHHSTHHLGTNALGYTHDETTSFL